MPERPQRAFKEGIVIVGPTRAKGSNAWKTAIIDDISGSGRPGDGVLIGIGESLVVFRINIWLVVKLGVVLSDHTTSPKILEDSSTANERRITRMFFDEGFGFLRFGTI